MYTDFVSSFATYLHSNMEHRLIMALLQIKECSHVNGTQVDHVVASE